MMSWEDAVFEDLLRTYCTPLPLDKVWSSPVTGDDPIDIPGYKEWVKNHKNQELMLGVIEMEDGTYFAPEQYVILQAMKEAGRTTAFCRIQEYRHISGSQK